MKKMTKHFSSKLLVSILLLFVLCIGGCSSKNVFNQNQGINTIPKVVSCDTKEGEFVITEKTAICIQGKQSDEINDLRKQAKLFADKALVVMGYELLMNETMEENENSILLTTLDGNKELGSEGYEIESDTESVIIRANTAEGIARGIQTLRQLLPAEFEKQAKVENVTWAIPAVSISDKPEYEYRGMMIDVARHFFSVDEIKRQIDLMSQFKINKLHLHLTDDQGWRLEIKKWPELTNIGGSSAVNGDKGGYYTQEDYKEIVHYANERYIEVIPEIEMPGHCNAALASYDFLNKDNKKKSLYTGIGVGFSSFNIHDEQTYSFIDDVIKEIALISPSEYIHIGGDEVHTIKSEDYGYFVGRVANIVKKYNKKVIGWDPIDISPEITADDVMQYWGDSNFDAQEKGMKMIISKAGKAYLDMKYKKNSPYGLEWAGLISIKEAYNWDPTNYASKDLILGIESPVFAETINDRVGMDYLIYPRLLGYAEIGWTSKSNRNWEEYKKRLKQFGIRLENQEIGYYKDPSIW